MELELIQQKTPLQYSGVLFVIFKIQMLNTKV